MFLTSVSTLDPQSSGETISLPDSSPTFESTLVNFDNKILGLFNGKLYLLKKESKKWFEWKSAVSSKKIRSIKSKFGVLLVLTDDGGFYACGISNSGQCGMIQEEPVEEFRKIEVVRKLREPCPHGIKFDDDDIIFSDVDCTSNSVFIVDVEGRIWTFGGGKIIVDSDGKIQVSQINIPRKVINIYCGRAHCLAFCEVQQKPDLSVLTFDESSQTLLSPDSLMLSNGSPSTLTTRKNSVNQKCEQCIADSNCRLSLLMKIADESACSTDSGNAGTSNHSSIDTVSLHETPKRTPNLGGMRAKLEKLRFNFRSSTGKLKQTKEKSNTVWHTGSLPLGSSLGSFGSPKSSKKEEEGVEMSLIGTSPRQQSQPLPAITDLTGSATFSYVNLDYFIAMNESSLSTTPESSLKRPSISTHSNLSSDRSPVKSNQKKSLIPLFGELWSWGNNQNGQLGHADTISRREPKKIRTISGPILKISVGDDHNVVLLASGEAYVWGSNSKEQLKYLNQSFLDSPTLWRLGAESTILDVEAGKELTATIVVGQSRKEQVSSSIFLFGKQNDTNSSTTILSKIEQNGSSAKLFLLSDDIWIGMLNTDDVLENKSYSKIQAVSKVARFSGQLNVLAQKLINSSQDFEIIQLLKNLCEKVGLWNEIQSKLSAAIFKSFTFFGDAKLSVEVAKDCGFRDICRSILELHFAFIEAIAFRCFSEIKLESDLAVQVEKLCLDYNTESNLQQRRLRYLFGRPFDFFKALRSVLDNTMTESLPQNFWKHFDRTLERNEGYSKQTYAANKELAQFGIENINRPGRLIIWTSHESSESTSHIKVKDTGSNLNSASPWRRFIGTNFISIVIFSDSFALIQSGSQVFLESPLVWMNCLTGQDSTKNGIESTMTESEKELTVQVLSPEYEFYIEFPAVEMKNDMLNAFSASFRLHRERTELSVFEDIVGTSVHVLPQTRFGFHEYSPTHYLYRNCRYEGYWKNGVPHGQGCLKYPDGREYKGRFEHGIIQGFGEMKIPELAMAPSPLMSSMFFTDLSSKKIEKYHHYKGKWKNGKLHGLAHIVYSNGDTFEGYCANGLPEGHGVLRSSESNGGQQVYVGGWLKGAKNGYGVLSLNKERYLGMWKDDLRHGKGCQITIDGVFHEGIFDKDRFTKGRIVYQTNESDTPASFEGEFEKMGIVSGKGILRLTPQDQIEGLIYGQILTGELKITNATYSRKETCPISNSSIADLQFVEQRPINTSWAVPAEIKWKEIFDHFLYDELGFSENGTIDQNQVKRAWERLSTSVEKIKTLKKIQIDDRLERIPDVYSEWSSSYYASVTEYWHLCLTTPHHPIYRLINGLVEIFCCSYNNIGTHAIMYDSAILEFLSLIERTYTIFQFIFPNLPTVDQMYQNIPDVSSGIEEEKDFAISSSSSSDNGSIKSETKSKSMSNSDDFTVATPCCDFVIHYLFGQCYAELFTMYSVKCHEVDKKYWERVVFLNTATDARLLSYLGVQQDLWPIDAATSDLDKFMVRVTARKKFYETAIHTLQKISCEFNPSSKLAILAETFSEISMCVSQFATVGKTHVWSGDDLLPAFMYVVVRAQLQHLGAEIRLINDFCPQVKGSGQIDLMFTVLCASYVQICNEKSVP